MDFESEWKKVPDLILQFENELKNKRNRVLFCERFPDCYCKFVNYKPKTVPIEKEMGQMVFADFKREKELLTYKQNTCKNKIKMLNYIMNKNKKVHFSIQ